MNEEAGRQTMEVYLAADLSAETGQVAELPLQRDQAGLTLAASIKS